METNRGKIWKLSSRFLLSINIVANNHCVFNVITVYCSWIAQSLFILCNQVIVHPHPACLLVCVDTYHFPLLAGLSSGCCRLHWWPGRCNSLSLRLGRRRWSAHHSATQRNDLTVTAPGWGTARSGQENITWISISFGFFMIIYSFYTSMHFIFTWFIL